MKAVCQNIMTIDAKALFKYFPIKGSEEKEQFVFNARKKTLFPLVVRDVKEFDDCPMLNQLLHVIKCDSDQFDLKDHFLIYKHFFILDFDDVFMPIEEDSSEVAKNYKNTMLKNAEKLIDKGLKIQFDDEIVEFVAFDKSGNMSRNSRISFLDKRYLDNLNERLNLGINFKNIPVVLSKYYAYRGLYLSSSSRVEHEKIDISEKTVIVIKDNRKKENSNSPIFGNSFSRDVPIMTAKQGNNPGDWEFLDPEKEKVKTVDKPFDGVGVIDPEYVEYINKALGINGANSFQIRLPFVKGMLHEVDVLKFIDEFSIECASDEKYKYIDAFNIERDLRDAHIFITESMLKGKAWIVAYCKENNIEDPMKFYCEQVRKFDHSLYISGTNLPYGHSKYTHLSYQVLNTLDFKEDEFKQIIEQHEKFIDNPVSFWTGWDESYLYDNDIESNSEQDNEEIKSNYKVQNWKLAVSNNESLAGDAYVRMQLENTQKGLLGKIASGKVLVEGQTRYLCRDLIALLATLLKNEDDIESLYFKTTLNRFYFPEGENNKSSKLEFEKYYAFFRNPHLSRNEQFVIRPFIIPQIGDTFANDGKKVLRANYEEKKKEDKKTQVYEDCVKIYDKYFGKLTGVVMVPRGSTLPLCLGGADFDGDLVKIIFNQNVVNAVKRGGYQEQESQSLNWFDKSLPAIEIPETKAEEDYLPMYNKEISKYVTFKHINDTFANHIGRISNAAIAIGQDEYDRSKKLQEENKGISQYIFNPKEPSCDKCTLLTGLEIDAAKNGIHPNLDIILKSEKQGNVYLKFLRQFRELKSEENFKYDNLVLNEEDDVIVLTAKNCNSEVLWDSDNDNKGTYINLLPKYFFDNYKKYKSEKNSYKKYILEKRTEGNRAVINEFKSRCNDIFDIYNYNINTLLKELKKEKKKGFYAVENTEVLLMRMYDDNKLDAALYDYIPSIKEKIKNFLSDNNTIVDIRQRINELNWQFQPLNRRGEVLEQIVGNGFKESCLTEQEKELLYYFNQQGYKLLWRIMDLIEGPKWLSFEDLYTKIEEKNNRDLNNNEFENLDVYFEGLLREYYDNNFFNVEQVIYNRCLNELRNMIDSYTTLIGDELPIVEAFYQNTKTTMYKAKFFWDAFSWEEMKDLFKAKEHT